MDEKDFRKHLADLAHGHHHAEEHDWDEKSTVKATWQKDQERSCEKRGDNAPFL